MSSDKNPEVVGCDASIMRNVWEIRLRERDQKQKQEQERQEKSALASINKEWADRLNARRGNFKRTERQTQSLDFSLDTESFWKGSEPKKEEVHPSKKEEVRPPLSRGKSMATPARPAPAEPKRKPFTPPPPTVRKEKKPVKKDKTVGKAQHLMSINMNEPSPLVWGKSWKGNKSLPEPEEPRSEWGECWTFAMYQPEPANGHRWPEDPNMVDPWGLRIWEKQEWREVESVDLDWYLPEDEWEMSWRKPNKSKSKESSSANQEDEVSRGGYFTMLLESQHRQSLHLPEWSDSWRATKPSGQQEDYPVPGEDLIDESDAPEQETTSMLSWDECWRSANLGHHGNNKPKVTQVRKPLSAGWVNSWRAAPVVMDDPTSFECPPTQGHSDATPDNYRQHDDSFLHKIMWKANDHKYRDLYQQLREEFKGLPEWKEWKGSWEVTKNDSDPSEEIEKVLNAQPANIEIEVVEDEEKWEEVEESESKCDLPKHDIIYQPKSRTTWPQSWKWEKEFSFSTTWVDSWRTTKHRMRTERRRMRPDPSRPFREPGDRGSRDWVASEWTNSWINSCQPLLQEPEFWEQGWSTQPQPRVNRALDPGHFAPVELPKNGPTSEHSWGESWRSRNQNRSQPRQTEPQSSQRSSGAATWRHEEPSSDWNSSWMVSDSRFHHDTPSLVQWREAWRWSPLQADSWSEQMSTDSWVDQTMEIRPVKKWRSVKLSRTFDDHTFKDRFPKTEWGTSWSGESILQHQPTFYGAPASPPPIITPSKQQATASDHGCMWGLSFRLANPMPIVEQPWLESHPNMSRHKVLWSKGRLTQKKLPTTFNLKPEMQRMWKSSHLLLQGHGSSVKQEQHKEELSDPRVILTKSMETRGHLISNIENEKQPSEKTCTGGHLLGKSQPRPKKPMGAVKKVMVEDTPDTPDPFLDEWAESWRSLEVPGGPKKKRPMRSLTGWDDSWKFLLPLYQMANVPKTK